MAVAWFEMLQAKYGKGIKRKTSYDEIEQINAAVLNESNINAQDMKDVTGLHDASLGARSNETSGKAINARQREGDIATYVYPDNLTAAIREGQRSVPYRVPVRDGQ